MAAWAAFMPKIGSDIHRLFTLSETNSSAHFLYEVVTGRRVFVFFEEGSPINVNNLSVRGLTTQRTGV
jgi:hypothetical protein